MKIAEFILRMEIGGAQDIVKKYAYALQKSGHEVIVIVYTPKTNSIFEKELKENHIKTIYIGELYQLRNKRNGMALRFERQIKSMIVLYKVLDKLRPDIFHIHSELFRAFVWMPWRRWDTKLIFTAHNESKIVFHSKVNLLFARWLHDKHNMRIIALSEKHYKNLATIFGKKNIYIVRNGIDIDKFKDAKPGEVKKELQIKDKFVIGNIGRFESAKNHVFMLDIFREVVKKKDDAVLLLIGTGSLEGDIRRKAEKYNIQEKVIFAGVRSDIPELLKVINVFLMPSLFEGIPVALIEAQAAGLDCVISDNITDDAIISNKTEKISLDMDAVYWARKIISIHRRIADIDYKRYDLQQCIKRLLKIYES